MSDVFNLDVGELALREIIGWLFGNPRAACGSVTLIVLGLTLGLRRWLPRVVVPQQGIAIVILCAALLALIAGIGERRDNQALGWPGKAAAHASDSRPASLPLER
jgi:hypothetical protein